MNSPSSWAAECYFGKTLVNDFFGDTSDIFILQSLIPLKEEWDMKSDEKKTSESYRLVCEENKEVMEVSGFILCFLYEITESIGQFLS